MQTTTSRAVRALALAAVCAAALAGCAPSDPEPTSDPRAVSTTFQTTGDGYVAPGSGVAVGITVPTYFKDSTGQWQIDLTIDSIVEGKPEDLSVVTGASQDLSGLVPYYTTITATITHADGDAKGKSIGTLFDYQTLAGAPAPRMSTVTGVFPACGGSDAFADSKGTITFCQVSLATPGDPVDQVSWIAQDTIYAREGGSPVFFRPLP